MVNFNYNLINMVKYTDKDIDRLAVEQLKWQKAQAVLGAFIAGQMTRAIESEDYMRAAQWRDLNSDLQSAETAADATQRALHFASLEMAK
jgi:hypothetical protein